MLGLLVGTTARALCVGACIGVPFGIAQVGATAVWLPSPVPLCRRVRGARVPESCTPRCSRRAISSHLVQQALVGFALKGQWLAVAYCSVASALACAIFALVLRLGALWRGRRRPMHAAVVVLGDIGRSPRMMNHAVSLANAGFRVSLIGYAESAPPAAVRDNKNITVRGIPPPWKLPRKPKIAYFLLAPVAALARALTLALVMLQGGRKGVILVQNPPSIPTLLVARLLSWFVDGSALVIDWHNYGFTIMQSTGAPRPLIKLASAFEHVCGPWADGHLCVSDAMRRDLAANWRIPTAKVLYDRAPARFRRRSEAEKQALIRRLSEEEGVLQYCDFYTAHGLSLSSLCLSLSLSLSLSLLSLPSLFSLSLPPSQFLSVSLSLSLSRTHTLSVSLSPSLSSLWLSPSPSPSLSLRPP